MIVRGFPVRFVDLATFLVLHPQQPIGLECTAARTRPDTILVGQDCLLEHDDHGRWKSFENGWRKVA